MVFAGIDYSMTNPAMTILTPAGLRFFYMSTTESKLRNSEHIVSDAIEVDVNVADDIKDESINSSLRRFQQIAFFFITHLVQNNVTEVFLEGYALGARGKVFSIAENTAILKTRLLDCSITTHIIPPTVIKKFATGKGNAGKDEMKAAFESTDDSWMLADISHYKTSPYTDCIDSYWMLQYGIDKKA